MILREQNRTLLEQAQRLLADLTDDGFVTNRLEPGRSGIGPHLRHVIDYYRCFLDGWSRGRVDYDVRRRDDAVASQRDAARAAIAQIAHDLEAIGEADLARALETRGDGAPWCPSTVGRELQFLVNHTLHHYALIALLARAHGVTPADGFGVAPSTLEYEASQHQGSPASHAGA
ncbi:MAG: DinB family protein [Acidobacteriota bacterium]